MFISIFITLSCFASFTPKKGGGYGGGPNLLVYKALEALKLRPSVPPPDAGTWSSKDLEHREIQIPKPEELGTQGGPEKRWT